MERLSCPQPTCEKNIWHEAYLRCLRGAKGKPPIRRTKIGVFELDDKTLRGHSPSLRSVYIQEVEHSFLKLFVRGLEQVEFVAWLQPCHGYPSIHKLLR